MEYISKISGKELSQRKIEEYYKISKIVNWGRANPTRFAEEIFGIKLIDFQAWAFMQSWAIPYAMWLECRGAGKTSTAAIFLQTKLLLIPNYKVFISTLTADQSADTFKKLEDIALQRIPQFRTCTDIFAREVEKSGFSSTGFIHDQSGHRFRLYNGSELVTLSSNLNALRGKRGSVLFDENAWQDSEHLSVLENYINVDSNFGLGTQTQVLLDPVQMPLQLLYVSSAGDVTYPFYQKLKTYTKKMIAGDSNYFVCDLDANTVLNYSTVDGIPIKSHLTKEQIEKQIEDDPDRADQELFNHFRRGAGHNSVVSMETLIRNSKVRLPLFVNDTGKRKFLLVYDPARNFDGSIIGIFETIEDKNIGYKLVLQNMVSMVDRDTEKKTPLPMPEQLKIIKELMINYNGKAPEWENIEFYIDAGAGGGGLSAVADSLMDDWLDEHGQLHRGIIDPVHKQYETSRKRYRNAAEIVRLVEPKAYKKIMFDSLEKNLKLGLIEFPEYDNKEFITLAEESGEIKRIELTQQEIEALTQCNLAKQELMYMCRYETPNGGITYDLVKDKQRKMHDDRAYVCAMAAYALSLMRRTELLARPIEDDDDDHSLMFRAPVIRK
jgi:hypothetical protein